MDTRIWPAIDPGRGDDVRHAHVLFVNEQRVGEIPGMLVERFAVIAEHDEEGVVVLAAQLAQPCEEVARGPASPSCSAFR